MSDQKNAPTKHFCILPWMHARVNQGGDVYPCCRMENFYSYGSLKKNSFNEIWNAKPIAEMRNLLKNDQAFSSCADCYKIEDEGGVSLRQKANRDFSHHMDKVALTRADGTIDSTSLEFLDIRFSNVCNFKCRSCNSENSTSWYHDARSFAGEVPTDVIRPTKDPDQMWATLKQQIPTLKRIYLAGGEPLLQEEHYQLLELLIAENRTDIAIEYNTNLSSLEFKHWKVVELWKHFPHITLGASLDGVDEQGELIRKGMDWNKTVKNFETIRDQAPHVKFVLAPTISVMNCFHITTALEKFLKLGMLVNPDYLRMNILLQPEYLSVHVLNFHERKQLAAHYSAFLNKISAQIAQPLFMQIKAELDRIILHLGSSAPSAEERVSFKKFTIKLDQLRKEKTVLLFPELMNLIFDESVHS